MEGTKAAMPEMTGFRCANPECSIQLTRSAGNWGGHRSRVLLDGLIQKVSEPHQIVHAQDNSGSDYKFILNHVRTDERADLRSWMRKRQSGQIAGHEGQIEHSTAKRFWNVVRIYCGWLFRIHRRLS